MRGRPSPDQKIIYATETDLCDAFLAAVPAERWTAYAETQGWDILLVRRDGLQIGIEAKLRLNADVLNQTLDEYGYWHATSSGPDYRAVLVPFDKRGGLGRVAMHLGITVIGMNSFPESCGRRGKRYFSPVLPGEEYWQETDWHEWQPAARYELPEFVPDVAAGAPSPLKLTDWKIKALRLVATLSIRGFVTRHDFAHLKLDQRRWLTPGARWVKKGEAGRYVEGEFMPHFVKQHPRVYAEIVAAAEDWILKEPEPTPLLKGKRK